MSLTVDALNSSRKGWTVVGIEETLLDLSLGDALEDALGCVLSKVFRSEVTEVMITVASIDEPPTIESVSSPSIGKIATRAIEAAFVMYDELGEGVLPGFLEQALKGMLNEMLSELRDSGEEGLSAVAPLGRTAALQGDAAVARAASVKSKNNIERAPSALGLASAEGAGGALAASDNQLASTAAGRHRHHPDSLMERSQSHQHGNSSGVWSFVTGVICVGLVGVVLIGAVAKRRRSAEDILAPLASPSDSIYLAPPTKQHPVNLKEEEEKEAAEVANAV